MSEDSNYDDGFLDGEEAGYREHRSAVLMVVTLLCYLITAIGTFAWVHETSNTYNKEFPSALAGAVWPIYWSGRGALAVVRAIREPVKQASTSSHILISGIPVVQDAPAICFYASTEKSLYEMQYRLCPP